jgi:zinc/manganese transport system ATP-binding protein
MIQTGCAAVTLARGGRTILSNITLAFRPAEFIGVLGANGAGKTTFLRALLGLVTPIHGEIRVLGDKPRRGNPAIGYLPQLPAPPATARLRGRDILAAAVTGHRWGPPILSPANRRDIDRVLALVEGTALAQREFATLSGGERQRLAIAQALLGNPRLLLLDEPLISLDPHHQHNIVSLVRHLQQTLAITVLFSAHDINPLLGALDRVLYLGGGQAALGGVADVITAPVLSRLYGTPIEVVRLANRIFVLGAGEAALA